ncbi:hypothetical protein BX666DRAFT_881786 [Dichotomocladium elegans]|nr:hypothetical protein BX666DRAFT_881786 [Dichotomocladium elegans]
MGGFSTKKKEAGFDSDSETASTSPSIPSQSFERHDILVVATHRNIYAVHKRNGSRLWRSKFPAGMTGGVISLFITDQDKLVAAGNGKTAALDLFTGDMLWLNKMKGCGYEEVGTIVTPSKTMQPIGPAARDAYDQPPQYSRSTTSNAFNPVVIACTNGKCMGIDAESGEGTVKRRRERESRNVLRIRNGMTRYSALFFAELWLYNCPGGGFKIPTALVDTPRDFDQPPNVFVGCGTMLYCLEAHSGAVQWSTKISSSIFGTGYMTMATPWSSRLAAEAYTAFNQFPVAHQEDAARQRRRNC